MNLKFEGPDDPKLTNLRGGKRSWWDVDDKKVVDAYTLYLAQGCPDWGEKGGKRNSLCQFCALPHAAQLYRDEFFEGMMSQDNHLELFQENLRVVIEREPNLHTLMIFNAGSFLAQEANEPGTQSRIMEVIAQYPLIRRVVIESRAELIPHGTLAGLVRILDAAGKRLTIRIGVETQDDYLRTKVLRKGHSRKQLEEAVKVMRALGVTSGGYTMMNPAPNLDSQWAMQEGRSTVDWILGDKPGQLHMDEAYFCSTNVGQGTMLAAEWRAGRFRPASLWMVFTVFKEMEARYGPRVHLLPFSDEPPFLAVPSNHVPEGIPQDLSTAQGCDLEFHSILSKYRQTMDPAVLVPPKCDCCPSWL